MYKTLHLCCGNFKMCLSDISSQRLWMLLFASSKCSSLWSSSSGMASHLFSKKIVSSGSKQNISSLESLTCWIIRQSYKKIKCEIVKKNQKVKKVNNGKHNFSILLVVRKLFSFTGILIDRKFTIISTNWKHKKHFCLCSYVWPVIILRHFEQRRYTLTSWIFLKWNCTYIIDFLKRGMSTKLVTNTLLNWSICLKGDFYIISSYMRSVNKYNFNCKVSKSSPIIHHQSQMSEVQSLYCFIVKSTFQQITLRMKQTKYVNHKRWTLRICNYLVSTWPQVLYLVLFFNQFMP